MGEWIDFERWHECVQMQRPGIIFEVTNEADQRLFTQCAVPLDVPFDWNSRPVRFRMIPAPLPRHSDPLPKPSEQAD